MRSHHNSTLRLSAECPFLNALKNIWTVLPQHSAYFCHYFNRRQLQYSAGSRDPLLLYQCLLWHYFFP